MNNEHLIRTIQKYDTFEEIENITDIIVSNYKLEGLGDHQIRAEIRRNFPKTPLNKAQGNKALLANVDEYLKIVDKSLSRGK